MKIIKEGKLPTQCKVVMEGTCKHCGCVIQEEREDHLTKLRGVAKVKCPTYGCPEDILMFGMLPQMPSEYYNTPYGS